jgi:hypothetical protein
MVMASPGSIFNPEQFQETLRAGWCQKKEYMSTNLSFMGGTRMYVTPFENNTILSHDKWVIGIEVSVIDDDSDRKEPEILTINHAFGSCEITTQFRCPLPHPIPLVPTSRRAHRWWVDNVWQDDYYFSARLIVVEVPGSYGASLDNFLAVFYSPDGRVSGQIGVDDADYAWPRRCVYLPDSGPLRTRSTTHTLTIPPTCRLFDIRRELAGGYGTFEALTEPMDYWNVMALRRPGLTIGLARGLMWMNGRGARAACAAALARFKEELFMRTWAPERHVEWCLDVEEQAEMLAHGETFEDWREAARSAAEALP